ncbi:IucA/IucC family protein [Paenibacillus ehimensis]|uniref:IucA/IucC family protein n=1 Tax=Paenibacillus ehimensis TaxID=79264 RepID=UPI0004724484|nr:IucA/IucC family protein [Paenibacillus ehimensis]
MNGAVTGQSAPILSGNSCLADLNRSGRHAGDSAREARIGEAEERIVADLVNALLAEGFMSDEGIRGDVLEFTADQQEAFIASLWPGRSGPQRVVDPKSERPETAADRWLSLTEAGAGSGENAGAEKRAKMYRWWVERASNHYLVFPVVPSFVQAYRYVAGGGVYEVNDSRPGEEPVRLGAMELLRRVTDTLCGPGQDPGRSSAVSRDGVARLTELLRLSLEQARWSAVAADAGSAQGSPVPALAPWHLVQLERRAAWRDRPFHPVAKAKGGWTEADYRAYSAESGRPITLQWLAVKRQYLIQGSAREESRQALSPAELLLASDERAAVEEAMKRRGLSSEEYTALPAHPWQLAAVLPNQLRQELASGLCVPLDVEAGVFYATSSARSLAPQNGGAHHVKLPLGIVSLGAVRYLPAVHMMNGERGQRLLEQARERDPVLRERLSLCDERNWWAYLPEDGDYFADPPRHLSALVRKYPPDLTGTEGIRLVPMSALAVQPPDGTKHMFDMWMRLRDMPVSADSAARLFGDVCVHFCHIVLRLFRLGVLPEIHGQNAVLVLRQGVLSGLLLRDHDSIRLHLPWMREHGLDDPCYKMKPGYPNSLYNETPQKLLFYMQTLGIQVNLYSILETIALRYKLAERKLWLVLKESLLQAIELAGLPPAVRELTEDSLFRQPNWPWKNLIKPLLEQEGAPSGSMPSGVGRTVNPFARLT